MVCLWNMPEKSYTICLRVYFYIPMRVSSWCVSSMCCSYVHGYTFVYPHRGRRWNKCGDIRIWGYTFIYPCGCLHCVWVVCVATMFTGILLYTRIEGGVGTSEGMSVFVGILLYTHEIVGLCGCDWKELHYVFAGILSYTHERVLVHRRRMNCV